MKVRLTLQTKILLLASLNVVLLVTVFLIFARFQFKWDLGSFLMAPARESVLFTSRLASLELPTQPRGEWDKELSRTAVRAQAELSLFDEDGMLMAGTKVEVPDEIKPMLRLEPHRGPPPEDGRGPDPEFHRRPPPFREDLQPEPVVFRSSSSPNLYWAAAHLPLAIEPGAPPRRVTLLWRFDSLWTNPFFFDYKRWLGVVGLIVLVSVACWLPFIRGLTKSISRLKTATGKIAEGHFEVTLPTDRRDEIGLLSESINEMAQRLSGYMNGQKRFLGDIAHELCSPIARVQLGLGILDQHASAEEQPYVARVSEEIQHMTGLVNELLSFSKASLGATADLESVNVGETVRKAVEREAPQCSGITCQIDSRLAVVAQRDYLFRAISNVLRNAIRYAGQAGPIVISAKQDGGNVLIKVQDEGPGVAAAELNEIMKPFYRPESARQRETGGVGLGLAIVCTCIEACGGTATCRNRLPKGFEVELSLIAA